MQRGDNTVRSSQSVTSLTFLLSFLSFSSGLMRCDDDISVLLVLTTAGVEPLRRNEPLSKGILFIHCNASSHRKWENGGSELAMPQKGTLLVRTMALTAEPVIQCKSTNRARRQEKKETERQTQTPSTICMRVQEAERSIRQHKDLKSS